VEVCNDLAFILNARSSGYFPVMVSDGWLCCHSRSGSPYAITEKKYESKRQERNPGKDVNTSQRNHILLPNAYATTHRGHTAVIILLTAFALLPTTDETVGVTDTDAVGVVGNKQLGVRTLIARKCCFEGRRWRPGTGGEAGVFFCRRVRVGVWNIQGLEVVRGGGPDGDRDGERPWLGSYEQRRP